VETSPAILILAAVGIAVLATLVVIGLITVFEWIEKGINS
jgi:hypothetical protein